MGFPVSTSHVDKHPYLKLKLPEGNYAFHLMGDTVGILKTKISTEFDAQTEISIKRGNVLRNEHII